MFERSNRILFRDLSFTLNAGKTLFIKGINGSGKSSLLRLLAGLSQPIEGSIVWNGNFIQNERSSFYQQLIYLGHRSGVNDRLSVVQHLKFITALSGVVLTNTEKALKILGLSQYADVIALHLSAGLKKRLALARLVIQPAQLWLLDEPSTSLDREGQILLEGLMDQHLKKKGMIVLASHHSLAFAEKEETLCLS